jgi:hypothetical protein
MAAAARMREILMVDLKEEGAPAAVPAREGITV